MKTAQSPIFVESQATRTSIKQGTLREGHGHSLLLEVDSSKPGGGHRWLSPAVPSPPPLIYSEGAAGHGEPLGSPREGENQGCFLPLTNPCFHTLTLQLLSDHPPPSCAERVLSNPRVLIRFRELDRQPQTAPQTRKEILKPSFCNRLSTPAWTESNMRLRWEGWGCQGSSPDLSGLASQIRASNSACCAVNSQATSSTPSPPGGSQGSGRPIRTVRCAQGSQLPSGDPPPNSEGAGWHFPFGAGKTASR